MDKDIRYKEMIGYLKESKEFIFINIVTMVFISAFLVSEDLPIIDIFLIIVVWICLLFGFFIINYLKRQRYHKKIEKMLDELDKKYLITDIIEFSQSMEDDFYYHIMRICNKAMLDEIYQEKRERLEYKEYIEQWIHDIKNPLATVKLICDNNRSEATTKILIETSRINNYIEQALYYARSANVEKDYLIREVLLSEIISKVLHTKLSKTKLINLLNADKTVEGHLQNKKKYFISLIVTIISFASAVIMIKDYLSTGRGYMSNIPSVVSNKYQLIIGILLVCGIFSGYYAVSYIIYVVKERSKHYKYKKLNGVFISNLYARSASNAKVIASATIAIAVSILGFVVAPVLADISEEFLKFRMPYDLMINNSYRYIDKKSDIPHIDFSFVNRILNEHGIKESEICQQEGYFVLASNFENMETRDNKWDMPRLAVSLSDYNQMRKMAGLSPIELAEDEFALQASNEIDTESMKAKIEAADHEITLDNGQKIKLSENPIYNDAVGEYLYNFGNSTSFIFPDSICENLDIATTCYYVNTVETIPISICNKIEDEIKKEFRDEYTILYSKYETKYQSDKDYQDFIEPIRFVTQEKNAVKLNSVCMRLLGVYIGVIFFVICLTALSLQQLSDAENNKKQYGIMYKLGVEKSDIYKLIRKQISMFFAVPCFLAISGACVGIYVFMIRFGHKIVAYIGTKDFMLNIAIAIAMLLIIFVTYFIGTIKAYQHSVSAAFERSYRKRI